MGRHKQRDEEKRRIILMWLDTASRLAPGNVLFVPMKHGNERSMYRKLGSQIVRDIEASYEKSVYHGLILYGTSRRSLHYLAIEKPVKITNKAFIRDKSEKKRALQVLVKSCHTRKAQIILLLSEGYTKETIIKALGASITPEEHKLLK